LVRGAYHFGHANEDANTQAQLFVNTVINAGGFKMSNTLPLVLDIEVTDNVSSDTLWAWTQTFCATVHSMTGRAPIIYTVSSFFPSD
jgi:lysozyme